MNWIIWRLHRTHLYIGGAFLAALAVVLAVSGLVMSHTYHEALTTCASSHTCADLSSILFQGDGFIIDFVFATMVVPLLLGIFWGAPLVASEFEDGTADLVWTQGISRRR